MFHLIAGQRRDHELLLNHRRLDGGHFLGLGATRRRYRAGANDERGRANQSGSCLSSHNP